MNPKLTLPILLLLSIKSIYGQESSGIVINPTGSYKLKSNAKTKNGETYGYFGDIFVKLIEQDKIAISLFVCKGYPSYNSGSFADTLEYRNNKSIYKSKEDSTCLITFSFSKKGIQVEHKAGDYNNSCGFGHAVVAFGFFTKKSSKVPIIKDPLEN